MNEENYKQSDPDMMILRDHLAFDRTVLANQRTFLAFFRTSIVVFGSGVALVKLFGAIYVVLIAGWASIVLSAIILYLGWLSYSKEKKALKEVYKKFKV